MRCFELEQPFYGQGKKDQVNHKDLTSLNFLKNAEATYFPNSLKIMKEPMRTASTVFSVSYSQISPTR